MRKGRGGEFASHMFDADGRRTPEAQRQMNAIITLNKVVCISVGFGNYLLGLGFLRVLMYLH